jgi:hypothetical protein
LTIVRPEDPSQDGPCANIMPSDDFLIARLVKIDVILDWGENL